MSLPPLPPRTSAGEASRSPATDAGRGDESRRWITRLTPGHHDRDAAIGELHALLRSAAAFEVHRRARASPGSRSDLDDIAAQAADDAVVAVLAKLGEYRGESRFTTWAYKFALLEAATIMRRQAWRRREVVLDADQWSRLPAVPTANAETAELLRAIATAAKGHLTVHQREVLVSLAFDGVPIDVLAERLNTTRNALYKTLHDARRKLRRQLTADGHLDAPTPDVIPA